MSLASSNERPVSKVTLTSMLVIAGVLWVVFVAGVKAQEMAVGAGVLAVAGLFLYSLQRSETLDLEIRLEDVATIWRLPWYVLVDVWVLLKVLVLDVCGKRTGSFYRVCGFKTAKDDPRLLARRVLATAYSTMSPNFLVIGIDYKQSRMLFHQLERSSVSEMTLALGAQPPGGGKQ